MVSVMSGLGVAVSDLPPTPSAADRSPSSGNLLLGNRRKMYNFFGHRPPSELISSHFADYFPSAKRKELDKNVRKSIYRQSIYAPRRSSIAPSVMSGRESFDFAHSTKPSSPRPRPMSRMTMTSPPSSSDIPEEGEVVEDSGSVVARDSVSGGRGGVPRMSVSDDTGSVRRPTIDGDISTSTSASGTDSDRPPLLPAFEPFNESLSDSLKAYSRSNVAPGYSSMRSSPSRPPSMATRRNSASSVRSRMSTFSQFRRNRDRSDTASMLTVDEITAEVENRRASSTMLDETSEEEDMEPAVVGKAVLASPQDISNTGDVPIDGDEDIGEAHLSDDESEDEDSSEEEDDTEDDTEDEEEDEAGEDEHGKAFTSTGCKFAVLRGLAVADMNSWTHHQVD
jgi:mitogen-activated protein kinase kinase kinase